jgi:uncharacterized protein YjiS (DUF1127 family)
MIGDLAMSIIYVTTDIGQGIPPKWRALMLLKKFWSKLQDRQKRNSLRSAMHHLSDRELQDIGTMRSEIEYVTRSRCVDPQGARSI